MTQRKLPAQFAYLEVHDVDSSSLYRNAEWLISDFDAPIWEYQLCTKSVTTVDWNVTLEDGESLLNPKHKELLKGLKQYLIASTKNSSDRMAETNSLGNQRFAFDHTGQILDHLLLNTSLYQLATTGLEGLGKNELIGILKKAGEAKDADELFDWEPQVGRLCMQIIGTLSREALEQVLTDHPALKIVTPEQEDENKLGMPASAIPYARAALVTKGLLHKTRNRWQIKVPALTEIIYANTLFAKTGKRRLIYTLSVDENDASTSRECPAVRVSTCSLELPSSRRFSTFQRVLHRLGVLHEAGTLAPNIDDIESILTCEAELGAPGRFRTLPSAIALGAVRDAIEFHLQHGENLISSFCRLALHCVRTDQSPLNFRGEALAKILREETIQLGITRSCLVNSSKNFPPGNYFKLLRDNTSLTDTVRVYISCVQLVVGALMARRAGELVDLQAASCLDSSEEWLLFLNRKSTAGAYGIRHLQARPIEPIAVGMIKNLIRMQKILKRIGYIEDTTSLFSVPSPRGSREFLKCTKEIFNKSFDYFCDYFETAKNKAGERYYIRQHQLRRFFAMLFYHSNSFGGLETLQWMLAHTDLHHVWNYITESMTGAELMSSKSQHVAEQMHHNGVESYENLKDFLRERYGSDEFLLWDIDELEDEITQLQKEGLVEIDPDFFKDENGEQMRVVVKIVEPAA